LIMTRGKELEKRANECNMVYRKQKKALILQIPTPMLITNKGIIPQASTVDFAGLIEGGKFIAYDAKETLSKTNFPLSNIKQHQLEYLSMANELGGIAFFLIHFKTLYPDKAFYTPISLVRYYEFEDKRKSIPIKAFKKKWLVSINNYLPHLLKMIKK